MPKRPTDMQISLSSLLKEDKVRLRAKFDFVDQCLQFLQTNANPDNIRIKTKLCKTLCVHPHKQTILIHLNKNRRTYLFNKVCEPGLCTQKPLNESVN